MIAKAVIWLVMFSGFFFGATGLIRLVSKWIFENPFTFWQDAAVLAMILLVKGTLFPSTWWGGDEDDD